MFVFTSWAFLPFCFIPVVFLVPLRVRRMRKELAATGKITTAASIREKEVYQSAFAQSEVVSVEVEKAEEVKASENSQDSDSKNKS